MSNTDPNDPAYTGEQYVDSYGNLRGSITKRELFAKDFMAASISNAHRKPGISDSELAEISIARADALIKKLNETE